ncbi:MAG: glycosyltransferase family 2 protein, partial [Candidatus Woesearchaeota archaeon]
IPRLLKALKKADIAIASRAVKGGKVETWTFSRKMISRIATILARPLTSVRDSMSGYFFLKKKVIKNIEFSSQGYKILLEVLVKGSYKKTIEVPYTFRTREVGSSKLGPKEYWKYTKDLIKLYISRMIR